MEDLSKLTSDEMSKFIDGFSFGSQESGKIHFESKEKANHLIRSLVARYLTDLIAISKEVVEMKDRIKKSNKTNEDIENEIVNLKEYLSTLSEDFHKDFLPQ
jgi:Mg2+ and Co2+ transporter CorA